MRKHSFTKAILAFMAGAAVVSSCVDDNYDLSNLDTTIQVGSQGTLRLPTSSTGNIVLDNLFDLAEDGPIQKIGDLYYLNKDGSANPDPIKIERINIKKPDDTSFEASIDLRLPGAGVKAQGSRKAGTGDLSYKYDISDEAQAKLEGAEARDISTDVLDITRISFTPTTATLEVGITGRNIDVVDQVHFDSLTLHLPTGIEITSCKYQGEEKLGSQELKDKAQNEGVIVLNAGDDSRGLNVGSGEKLTLQLTLSAANLEEGHGVSFDAARHSARLSGNFGLTGFARLSNEDINLDKLRDHLLEALAGMTPMDIAEELAKLAAGQYQSALDRVLPSLDFNGSSSFDHDLTVQTFSGALQHAINHINPIQLDNLPDFLEGDDVRLDLYNPQLYLAINSQIPTLTNTSIAFRPYKKNGQPTTSEVITTGSISYNGATDGTKVFCLAPHTGDITAYPDPFNNLGYTREARQIANLGKLIEVVPDRIEITGENGGDIVVTLPDCQDININREYHVSIDYRVYCPLTFGDDFQIVYRDTEEDFDLGDDLDDISVESLQLEGSAYSDIPLALNLIVTPMDKEEREIPGLVISYKSGSGNYTTSGLTIPAKAEGTPFGIRIQAAAGHTLSEYLHSGSQQLDGIKYEARLNDPTSNTEALKTTSSVQLKNVSISVTGASYLSEDD